MIHGLPIRQLRKRLLRRPEPGQLSGYSVRTFRDEDIVPWLQLRQRSFAAEARGVGNWSVDDFESQILGQAWWRPDRCWLVEPDTAEPSQSLAGAVMLALRGPAGGQQRPALHWLLVDPEHRRRGIATLLVATLEQAVWNAGEFDLVLETHAAWTAALSTYTRLGYA